ncbi:MAG TPA: proline--tRNA ligase [Verrucomicrobiae bacterium]|nr:proline--tRNA ligase [Verrucomicrobiae bacterium]
MRLSVLFTKTRKNVPADEKAKNAQLLIRAGYIHKEMAGAYSYLPLGLMVIENIKQIVREEMDVIGGQELLMTSLQPKATWEVTDRWNDEIVDIWFKSKLKDGSEVGFGWSHEEPIIEMIKQHLGSYRDLPITVYQFQTKLRNELRAKSGVMRGREFLMKDMYSCSVDAEHHEKFYQASIEAYMRVYERLGLKDDTHITFASGGAFTQFSHEFQTVCDAGEDYIFQIPSTGEAFNQEIAPAQAPAVKSDEIPLPMEEVEGKDLIGVEPLAKFLKIPVEKTTKTMLYVTDAGKVVAAAVRGGYDINEDKLKAVVGAASIALADEATVKRVTGAEVGYAGLLGLSGDVQIVVDESCQDRANFEMGANHTHHHSINVNWGRDLPEPDTYHDIKVARQGDRHPDTGEVYSVQKTAEVGNIFNFGTQKSEDMNFTFTNEAGEKQFVHLGSYGIGVSRLMGVVAEKFSDERGLIWPENVAPARVSIVRIGNEADVVKTADEIYNRLTEARVAVLYDDRDMRPGEKFADADLMGIPYRIVVSKKTVEASQHELKARTEEHARTMGIDELVQALTKK